MMKLILVAVAGLALVSSQANDATFSRELGPQSLVLHAGDGEIFPVDVSERSTIISNRLINLLNGYKEALQNGNDRHGVLDVYTRDVLGPYTIGSTINVLARLRLILDNLRISGISSYDIQSLVFSLLRLNLNMDMKIPEIAVQTNYNAELRLALFLNMRASGRFSLLVRGIDANVHLNLHVVSGGALQASAFNLELDVASTHMNISELTGVGFIDFLLNWIINNVSGDIIQQNIADIGNAISVLLLDTINDVLRDFTLDDLIGN